MKEKEHNSYIGSLIHGITSLLTGMKTTMTVFWRKKTTEQYPENRKTLKLSERFRGTLTMPHNEKNEHHCVACGLCQTACPNDTIKVTGEIDISNADSLRNAIDLALEQPTDAVELDFAQVSYIDSTGIGVLVGAAHHAVDHGKRFSCTNVQPPVMRVVQLLGVDQEISITAA